MPLKPVVILQPSATVIPPTAAKVLSPLRKVVEFLVPVAVSLASETVLSDGTPKSKTLPSIWMKSITSPVTKFEAKVMTEPLTVNEVVGACKIPFKLTSICCADWGDTLTEPTCIVYAAWLFTTLIASQTWKLPTVGVLPI